MVVKIKKINKTYEECFKCKTVGSKNNTLLNLSLHDKVYDQKNEFFVCEDCLNKIAISEDRLVDLDKKIIYFNRWYNCYVKRIKIGNKYTSEFYVLNKKVRSKEVMEKFLRDLNNPNSKLCKEINDAGEFGLKGSLTYHNFMKEEEKRYEAELDYLAKKAITRAMVMDLEDDDESWRICREDELDDF